ncbi:hypothetical protein A7318_00180 [Pseudomonas lurida]|uniref:NACHT domain-containing protein n=1 Tax=Pseudomonas lurida TaxID=244566 RepID=UPI00083E4E42|nr:NACHT domain-containing protein [Pseudomonas lurida]AOE77041.1 hypothetical protein A7318_00180 [Pseudomonas lurida]
MAEAGGPATQAGIRYQDEVAALYLGRMLDPRERPKYDQPVELRVEAPGDVDDFVVRFADGSRRFFQVKISLEANGHAWNALWHSFSRQIHSDFEPEDRIELVLGKPSLLASDLIEITRRLESSDLPEWFARLTSGQRQLVRSIQEVLEAEVEYVWRILKHLYVQVWAADALERDHVPLWIAPSSVVPSRLFKILAYMVWEGADVRMQFDGPTLYDRLRVESEIIIQDSPNWGSAQYREAVSRLSVIDVPGTDFRRSVDGSYLWPQCLRYDRNRVADFDDDLPGFRNLTPMDVVDLQTFPSADLKGVVVVAGPGFGKSTLIHAIAHRCASASLLPAVISVTKLSDSDLGIADYLSEVLNNDFDVKIDWRLAATAGLLVLLIDGLDEVSNERRRLILERLDFYRARYPGVRWLMTVRDAAALAPPDGATVLELAPLQDDDIRRYVDFYRPGETGVAEILLSRMAARPDLMHLARIPIFLALMLVMKQEGQDLRRSDLLDSYVEMLLRPIKVFQPDEINTSTLRRIAEIAAFEALENDTIGLKFRDFERCTRGVDSTLNPDQMRDALLKRGVLRKDGLVGLRFPFPIIQEYLASSELLENHSENLPARLSMIARRPWAQAMQFALERHPNPAGLVTEILEAEDDVFHTGLRLVGRCLANGMKVSDAQLQVVGERFARVWGRTAWRSARLIDGIIVDSLTRPLHAAIRAKLGDRALLHHGADTIVARLQDNKLTLEVLSQLLEGNIEHMLNIGELQKEVDRLGSSALNLYLSRCRLPATSDNERGALSCLIGHMKIGSIELDMARSIALDNSLPIAVRLAAWSKSTGPLSPEIEALIIDGVCGDGYHPQASAALALSKTEVGVTSVIRILTSPRIPQKNALDVMEYLIADWESNGLGQNIHEIADANNLPEEFRDLALLYLLGQGTPGVFESLIDRLPTMAYEMVNSTISMFGHYLDRAAVERAVSAIAAREWGTEARLGLAGAFASGLLYRIKRVGKGAGLMEFIPPHPGRTAASALLDEWLMREDYDPRQRLRMALDGALLGGSRALDSLRPIFYEAMDAPSHNEYGDDSVAGRTLELLHTFGEAPPLDELERIAITAAYNLASAVIAIIAKGGTNNEVACLIRVYEASTDGHLRLVILGVLEPLCGHLGIKITRSDRQLIASFSQ